MEEWRNGELMENLRAFETKEREQRARENM